MMTTFKIYIDESGDHRYRSIASPDGRYLALTAVIIRGTTYTSQVHAELEQLKRAHFTYDPDRPVVLTRSMIVKRKRWFGVLANPQRKQDFGDAILSLYSALPAQIFTVVIDKQSHKTRFPVDTFDAYEYSLEVLLNRIRGYLTLAGADAEIICECRGARVDQQIQAAYYRARTKGTTYASAVEIRAVYPLAELTMLRKSDNIAGLQIADMACYGQKQRIILENGGTVGGISGFTAALNTKVARMVNQYGHYLLE